jgi:hypothetical protein
MGRLARRRNDGPPTAAEPAGRFLSCHFPGQRAKRNFCRGRRAIDIRRLFGGSPKARSAVAEVRQPSRKMKKEIYAFSASFLMESSISIVFV